MDFKFIFFKLTVSLMPSSVVGS